MGCRHSSLDDENSSLDQQKGKYKTKIDPRILQKYDIQALIGKGSFSKVLRASHRATGQKYAIKMIEKLSHESKESCDKELRVLRRTRHQNIIQLIEIYEGTDKIYLVLELATGGELFDRILRTDGKSFDETEAVRSIKQILEGLRYLHNIGIAHRDLKPENILYSHSGPDARLLISDFGLAGCRRDGGGNFTMKTACGTAEYVAPEVLLRTPYTVAVDLWAVGVITYILISGQMPFDDQNKMILYKKILKANYDLDGETWQNASTQCKSFIQSLLILESEKRMTANCALSHAWITEQRSNRLARTANSRFITRTNSGKSNESSKHSNESKSLTSQNRRVRARELDELLAKYHSGEL